METFAYTPRNVPLYQSRLQYQDGAQDSEFVINPITGNEYNGRANQIKYLTLMNDLGYAVHYQCQIHAVMTHLILWFGLFHLYMFSKCLIIILSPLLKEPAIQADKTPITLCFFTHES